MSGEQKRVRFRVTGRVQGVGFRWWTKRTADELGVSGSVKNLPDGSVEVRVEGDATSLQEMERLLHVGPRYSRVDEVVVVGGAESDRISGRPDEAVGGLRDGFVILG